MARLDAAARKGPHPLRPGRSHVEKETSASAGLEAKATGVDVLNGGAATAYGDDSGGPARTCGETGGIDLVRGGGLQLRIPARELCELAAS